MQSHRSEADSKDGHSSPPEMSSPPRRRITEGAKAEGKPESIQNSNPELPPKGIRASDLDADQLDVIHIAALFALTAHGAETNLESRVVVCPGGKLNEAAIPFLGGDALH